MEHMEEEAKSVIKSLKPIERLFPKKPPYVTCGQYLASRKSTRELPRRGNFEHIIERSVATNYHFVLKDYFKIEADLKIARIKAEEQQKSMDQQCKELEEREQELRNSFVQYNEFMEQNQQKRERAAQKRKDTLMIIEKKTEDLEKLKKEYDQMKELVKLLDYANKQYIIYEKFLLEVANEDKVNFGSIEKIFSRYTALVKTKKDLTDLYENYMQKLEKIRNKTDEIIMEKYVQIEGMNNTITDLQSRFENSKIKAKAAEKFLHEVFLEAQNTVLDLQLAKVSCCQIYENICKRRNRKPVYINNPMKQLEIIKKALKKLSLVVRMVDALNDENWTQPTERESTSDSVVLNVVTKMISKK